MARRRLLVLAAFGCAALAALVYLAVVHVLAVQRLDVRILDAFMNRATTGRDTLARDVLYVFDPAPFAGLAALVVAGAVAAGRVRAGVAAGFAMVAANVTTQILKPLLEAPRPMPRDFFMSSAAWPSGHATAAVSLALALVLVSPTALRPFAAVLGALVTGAVAVAVVLLGWHYPSDALGGFLIAGVWTCLAAAAVSARAPRRVRAAAPATVQR